MTLHLLLPVETIHLFFRDLMPSDAKNITCKTVNKAHTTRTVSQLLYMIFPWPEYN